MFPTQEEVGHWEWVHGADWRHPEGPGSSIAERMDHPVVQVSCQDAEAYARWADKQLPSEAQWEWAARGGLLDAPYSWGEASPDSEPALLNKWQGSFPVFNTQRDGFLASAPVGQFPPNGYGLSDMSGNVWEWCADGWNARLYQTRAGERPQTDPVNPPEPTAASAFRSLRGIVPVQRRLLHALSRFGPHRHNCRFRYESYRIPLRALRARLKALRRNNRNATNAI
ncbi:MAG: SUMF1/EgtB/PvdO family nonheme iron enzyme [Planctomycetota bacterium]